MLQLFNETMVKKKLQFDKTILLSYRTFKTDYKIMTIKNGEVCGTKSQKQTIWIKVECYLRLYLILKRKKVFFSKLG